MDRDYAPPPVKFFFKISLPVIFLPVRLFKIAQIPSFFLPVSKIFAPKWRESTRHFPTRQEFFCRNSRQPTRHFPTRQSPDFQFFLPKIGQNSLKWLSYPSNCLFGVFSYPSGKFLRQIYPSFSYPLTFSQTPKTPLPVIFLPVRPLKKRSRPSFSYPSIDG